nr:hypothetical protein [Tanacetum cinerariifolium]
MALTFADTYNMIAYLTKSDASERFDQIIDFLIASAIKKKVIITEATVREDVRLDDAEMAQQADDVADEVVDGVDVDDVPIGLAEPTLPSPTPTIQPPPPSQELPSTSHIIPTPPLSPIAKSSSPP